MSVNWATAAGAVLFGVVVLLMIAPAVVHDPFSVVGAFLAGIFVGMLLSASCSERS
jgi:hypothetical protein